MLVLYVRKNKIILPLHLCSTRSANKKTILNNLSYLQVSTYDKVLKPTTRWVLPMMTRDGQHPIFETAYLHQNSINELFEFQSVQSTRCSKRFEIRKVHWRFIDCFVCSQCSVFMLILPLSQQILFQNNTWNLKHTYVRRHNLFFPESLDCMSKCTSTYNRPLNI